MTVRARPGPGHTPRQRRRRLDGAPDRHRPATRSPAAGSSASSRWLTAIDVHADLRRRSLRRGPAAAARVSSRARPDRHGHRRASAGTIRRAGLRRRPRRSSSPRSRRSARGGSTAGSSSSSRRSSTTSTAIACSLEHDALERLAAERQLVAYRHDRFWQCMDTLRDKRLLDGLWQAGASAVEGVGMSAFWRDRPTLVTGATGLVGGWLVRRLLDAGADVVCLVRDWVPAERARARRTCCDRVQGRRAATSATRRCSSACSASTRSTPSFTWPRRRSSPIANRNPVSTFETNIAGTWALARGVPPQPDGAADRPRLVRQGLRRSASSCPTTKTTPLQGRHPYDVSKSCADLIAQTYAVTYELPVAITRCGNFYGGGDLNWNRIVPGTIRSVLRGERPIIRSDGQLRPRLLLRRGRRRGVHAAGRDAGRRSRAARVRPSTSRTRSR